MSALAQALILAELTVGEMILGAVLLIAAVILLVIFLLVGQFFSLWLQAFMAKAGVSFWSLIGMKLRKVDSRVIVTYKITAAQAGLGEITTNMLESHYLAGGRVPNVVRLVQGRRHRPRRP
jgi:uncharacterized protein YqfA (UPF0365 family)